MQASQKRPWEQMRELISQERTRELLELLEALSIPDKALVLSRLEDDERNYLLTLLEPEDAADLIEDVSEEQAAYILSEMPVEQAGRIVDEMDSAQQAGVLGELDADDAEQILQNMEAGAAQSTRLALSYPKDTAGSLMATEFLAYREDLKIGDALGDLHLNQDTYRRYHVQYIYVTDSGHRLVGVLRIHDLLFSSRQNSLKSVMIKSPLHLQASDDLNQMAEVLEQNNLLALPVVDEAGVLLGIVLPAAVEEARRKHSTRQFLWFSGIIGGEEFRSMPLYLRSGRRLSWLSLNIVLNIIAASIIALYQDILAAAITLAVFLPMVSDMSGCSGNQAVAVSLRELSLGLLRPGEVLRVVFKESSLGLINGVALGILLGCVAFLWKGNIYLSLVIGVALAGNTVVAVTVGGVLPLVLKKLKIDPALVSSPLLTTVTDMFGFFLVLSLASAVLPKISS